MQETPNPFFEPDRAFKRVKIMQPETIKENFPSPTLEQPDEVISEESSIIPPTPTAVPILKVVKERKTKPRLSKKGPASRSTPKRGS